MDETEIFYRLGHVELEIPAWQMVLYVFLVSIFMLTHRIRLCLLTTYLFTLYWGFYLFRQEFITAAGGSTWAVMTYIICGTVTAALAMVAFFHEEH